MRLTVSNFPPSCILKVRSTALITLMPSNPLTAAHISSTCASLAASTTTSSRNEPAVTVNPRKLRMFPPTSPIAVHSRPSVPGSWASSTSNVAEKAAVGRDIESPSRGNAPLWRARVPGPNSVTPFVFRDLRTRTPSRVPLKAERTLFRLV